MLCLPVFVPIFGAFSGGLVFSLRYWACFWLKMDGVVFLGLICYYFAFVLIFDLDPLWGNGSFFK